MRESLRIMVVGNPAPQGSKTAYVRGGRAVMVEANKRLPEWRTAVMTAAHLAFIASESVEPFTQPVRVEMTFFIDRPKKPKWDKYPGSKPDLDHYIRAVGDSLTKAGVWADDSLMVEVVARKLWAGPTTDTYPEPGCLIFIQVVE